MCLFRCVACLLLFACALLLVDGFWWLLVWYLVLFFRLFVLVLIVVSLFGWTGFCIVCGCGCFCVLLV